MKEIIILKSRDGSKNYLRRLSEDNPKTYLLVTELETVGVGQDSEGNVTHIDPSGGPFIAKGAYLDEADAVVESFDHLKGKGFTITFE